MHWKLFEIDQWLLNNAKAECDYSFFALVKVEFAISKDIMDLINRAKAQNDIVNKTTPVIVNFKINTQQITTREAIFATPHFAKPST